MNKSGVLSYVLVPNTLPDNGKLYYYVGYFQVVKFKNKIISVAQSSDDYSKAMKIPFKDEAEEICLGLNKNTDGEKFHVEEHMCM
jgi:hypothetical protein